MFRRASACIGSRASAFSYSAIASRRPVGDRQQQSEVVVRLRIIDPGNRTPEIRLGLLIAAHRAQAAADVREPQKIPWHHLVIALKELERFLVASDGAQHAAKLDDSLGVVGIELERASRQVLRPTRRSPPGSPRRRRAATACCCVIRGRDRQPSDRDTARMAAGDWRDRRSGQRLPDAPSIDRHLRANAAPS